MALSTITLNQTIKHDCIMLSRNIVYIKYEYCSLRTYFCILYPRPPKGRGVCCFTSVRLSVLPPVRLSVLPPARPSFRQSVRQSVRSCFRPSKIFFVALFSVTVDDRNLIYGHKRYICIPYCG